MLGIVIKRVTYLSYSKVQPATLRYTIFNATCKKFRQPCCGFLKLATCRSNEMLC